MIRTFAKTSIAHAKACSSVLSSGVGPANTRKQGALYLHVFDWPTAGKLTLPALSNKLNRATLLAAPKTNLQVDPSDDPWSIELPVTAPDPIASVIKLDVEGMPRLAE